MSETLCLAMFLTNQDFKGTKKIAEYFPDTE